MSLNDPAKLALACYTLFKWLLMLRECTASLHQIEAFGCEDLPNKSQERMLKTFNELNQKTNKQKTQILKLFLVLA